MPTIKGEKSKGVYTLMMSSKCHAIPKNNKDNMKI